MTRRELRNGILFLLALLGIIGVLASKAYAQSPRNVYGEADFATRDNYPRDGLVACWDFLDAQPEGDMLQGRGDFESWSGASGGCSNCPTGWTCACTPTSDLDQETANIYKGSSGVVASTDAAANNLTLTLDVTLEKNTAYQFSFWLKGSAATDGTYFRLYTASATNIYYVSATDTWQVASSTTNFYNMGTSWVKRTIYFLTDNENRANSRLQFVRQPAVGNQTWYLDDVKLQKLKNPAPVSDTGIALSMPVTSDPSFGDCKTCQSFRGQSTDLGTGFDGVDDYMSIPDASGGNVFDPPNSFSVMACVTSNTVADVTSAITAKWETNGDQKGWLLMRYGNRVNLYLSDNGTGAAGHQSFVSKISLVANQPACIVATYQFVADGSSIGNLYVDELAAATNSAMDGPVFNNTAPFEVGASDTGATLWARLIQKSCYWNKSLSVIEANKVRNPYFPGNNNGPGFYVSSCTQAASHATCSHKNCRDGTPTACQAEGTGSMAVFGQYTGIQNNNGFETNTGTQDNPTFTGFTYTENAGDGTANISQYFGDSKHGASSLRIKLTGTTSYAFTGSTCNAMLPNTAYYAYVAAKCLNGKCPTNARVYVLEYSDAGCTLNLVSNSGTMSNLVTSSWKDYGVSFTSAATTNFYKIGFEARDGNSDTLFDNLDLKAASHHTPWVRVPSGGGAVTYNVRDYRLFNPLSSYVQSEGGFAYASGFCLGGWVYTDWAGDDGLNHYIVHVPGTAGNNNRWQMIKEAANSFGFAIYDGASGIKVKYKTGLDSINWTPGNWKYIEACTNNTGTLGTRHYNANNNTWYSWDINFGAGTGIQNGQSTTLNIGSAATTSPINGYIRNLTIGPYNAIWPMLGWNNGRVPPRPY